MGKIFEKIIARRLAFLINTLNIIYFNQINNRKQISIINIIISLIHDIQLAKHENENILILFINIKGTYNYISANQLLKVC